MKRKQIITLLIAALLLASGGSGGMLACSGIDDKSAQQGAGAPSDSAGDCDAEADLGSATTSSVDYVAHDWSYESAPLYYTVRGKADTTPSIKTGKIETSSLDSLGRTGRVVAKLTYKMVADSAGWRENMPKEADEISGWGKQYFVSVPLSNGKTYNGYAYNRSHLLADCLGGHAVKENLVTGTRMQNVGNNTQNEPGGMQYTEQKALNYLRSHEKGWVYYKATPIYEGEELLCRSVYVDILSDDGSIDEHVEVYNAMLGCNIDYKNGALSGSSVKEEKASR